MKVMKFGGTSVGSVDSILKVKQIVEAAEEPVIVVVSALGGITDKLINTSQMAANGDAEYEKEYREIVNRHIEMVYTVIPAGEGRTVLLDKVNELLSELKDIFQGIYLIKDLSSKTSATIVSYGERLSSIIAATLIKGAVWYDSRNFIKTEKKHAKHILDSELTTSLVKETFDEIPQVALVPGFISTDKNSGEVTNLGRGGSDYTASIFECRQSGDMDGCGRLYDRRPACHQHCLYHKRAELCRSYGALQLWCESSLSADYLSGVSQEYSHSDKKHL